MNQSMEIIEIACGKLAGLAVALDKWEELPPVNEKQPDQFNRQLKDLVKQTLAVVKRVFANVDTSWQKLRAGELGGETHRHGEFLRWSLTRTDRHLTIVNDFINVARNEQGHCCDYSDEVAQAQKEVQVLLKKVESDWPFADLEQIAEANRDFEQGLFQSAEDAFSEILGTNTGKDQAAD